jgi:hypothetical protein
MRRNKIKIPRSCTHKFKTGILYEADYAGGKYIFILPTIPILKQNLFGFMVITNENRDHIPNIEDNHILSALPIMLPDGTNGYIDLINIHVLSFVDVNKAPILGVIGDLYDTDTMKIIPQSFIKRYLADKYKLAVGCEFDDIKLNIETVAIDVNTSISVNKEATIAECQFPPADDNHDKNGLCEDDCHSPDEKNYNKEEKPKRIRIKNMSDEELADFVDKYRHGNREKLRKECHIKSYGGLRNRYLIVCDELKKRKLNREIYNPNLCKNTDDPSNIPTTDDNDVIKYDGVPISNGINHPTYSVSFWSDNEIGYFLHKYSDPMNHELMAKELSLSPAGLISKNSDVKRNYEHRKNSNKWGTKN